MATGLNTLAHTLALRLRHVARMLDRLDRLEAGTGEWLESQTSADIQSASLEMTLRALRTVAEPQNFMLLHYLREHPTCHMAEVDQALTMDRLSLNERVNDLVQIGLITREIDTDMVMIGEAGIALCDLVTSISQETTRRLEEYLAPVTRLD